MSFKKYCNIKLDKILKRIFLDKINIPAFSPFLFQSVLTFKEKIRVCVTVYKNLASQRNSREGRWHKYDQNTTVSMELINLYNSYVSVIIIRTNKWHKILIKMVIELWFFYDLYYLLVVSPKSSMNLGYTVRGTTNAAG